MTGPTTEAASISPELKDDAKQERVSRIASWGAERPPDGAGTVFAYFEFG
jgi:hypothetical protein